MHFLADTMGRGKSWGLFLFHVFGLAQIIYPDSLDPEHWPVEKAYAQRKIRVWNPACFKAMLLKTTSCPQSPLDLLASCLLWSVRQAAPLWSPFLWPRCSWRPLVMETPGDGDPWWWRPLVMAQANRGMDWGLCNGAEIKPSPPAVCSDVLNPRQKWCSIRRETDVYCVGTIERVPQISIHPWVFVGLHAT